MSRQVIELQSPVIGRIIGRKVFDSRGNPTIEVEVTVQDESGTVVGSGRAAAPSGASRGRHEVVAFPEGDVCVSLEKIRELAPKLAGLTAGAQEGVDAACREFDGTSDLHEVGGNAVVAISIAVAKAVASAAGVPLYEHLGGRQGARLPYPLGNVLGGGKHAGHTAPDIQEFLVLPVGAKSFELAASVNAEVHKRVRKLIETKDKTFAGGKGDEGAWAPNLGDRDALEIVSKSCEEISDEVGFDVRPALDVAASSLYGEKGKKYVYEREGEQRDAGEQVEFILELIDAYELVYVEDPVQEEDFESFAEITRKVGKNCLVCGDDLFVTNVERIKKGIEAEAANAVLIKPNQIGTLTDTQKAVELSKENGYVLVMSHRSGETPDDTIAHLAVGFGCPIIKTGVVGGERVAKLNELIRIEEELGDKARMGEVQCR